MLLYLRALLAELTEPPITQPPMPLRHDAELTVDSRTAFNLLTTTKDPEEKLNKADLAAVREAFKNSSLRAACWCPGYYIVADSMTKDNKTSDALLLKVLSDDLYPLFPETL